MKDIEKYIVNKIFDKKMLQKDKIVLLLITITKVLIF